uniref:hypothetical protein n=1 Tax=Candidatus Electronema sp. TaxID=2698783 RepID=UPI004056F20B
MAQLVSINIPQDWLQGVPEEDVTLKEIVRMGIREYKIKRAVSLYRDGVGSLGYLAEKMGFLKQELIREFRARNIVPEFSEETLQEELG